MEPTPRPTWSPPEEYITAKEAFARILPAAREWDAEFVVVSLGVSWHRIPEYRPQSDGTASSWDFILYSPTKWTRFYYSSDGSIHNAGCFDHKPATMCEHKKPIDIEDLRQNAVSMDEIIDSDEAAAIVHSEGIPDTVQLGTIGVSDFASPQHIVRRPAWVFGLRMSDDVYKYVFVDMLTGEITYDEFANLTSPTNDTQP